MAQIKSVLRICAGILLALFCLPGAAAASDIGISPSSGVSLPNAPFKVDIMLLNNGQAINAVSGSLSFPADLLSVQDVSKDGSIIKLWSSEPSYSNADGLINFEGVIFNPGFSATQGKVLTVTFMPKRTGKANLLFASGSVLANDGKATSVLGQLGSASFTISSVPQVSGGTTSSTAGDPLAPLAPKILSSTHSDSNRWYNSPVASFSWDVPEGVTAIRLLYDGNPISAPSKTYEPAIASRTIDGLADGVYYFHAQFKNRYGWGGVAHFRFQVDRTAPKAFGIAFPQGSPGDNPQPPIQFNAVDEGSGIDRYEVKVGDGNVVSYAPEASSSPRVMPLQQPGKHTIVVRAVDRAGNSTLQSADFVVDSIAPPTITSYPEEMGEGDLLRIRGTTHADAVVTVFLKARDGQVLSESAKSDSVGAFSLVWGKRLDPGVYAMTARVTDGRGAQSGPSSPVNIVVNQRALWLVGSIVINYLSIAIIVILALFAVTAAVLYAASRLMSLKRRLRKDVVDVEKVLRNDLALLRDDFKAEIGILEHASSSRGLTKEEATILKNLNRRLSVVEKAVTRKLEDLKKDIG